jgi:hypothetical protein
MKLDAKHFADEIAPKLVALLDERKDELIGSAGSFPRRAAVKLAWPTLIAEIPQLTETLIELLAWKFGDLTVNDLVMALDTIKKSARSGR